MNEDFSNSHVMFIDASKLGYGFAIYNVADGCSNLLYAKSRFAPVRAETLPTLSPRHTYNNVGKTASRLQIVTQSRDNAMIIGLSRQRQDSLQTVFRRQQDCPTMGTTVL